MSTRTNKIMKLALSNNIKYTVLPSLNIPEQESTKGSTYKKPTEELRDFALSADDLEACRKSAREALDQSASTSTDHYSLTGVLHPQGVKRKLFTKTDDMEETTNDLSEVNSRPHIITEITKRLNAYVKHRKVDFRNGNPNSARKKSRKIGFLKAALANAERGEPINLAQLPDFPESSTLNSMMDTEITEERINSEADISDLLPPIKIKEVRRKHKCLFCDLSPRDYADHVERSHRDTLEGQQLREISAKDIPAIERSKLKRKVTSEMTKKVTSEQNREFFKQCEASGELPEIETVKRWTKEKPNARNTVKCRYCSGFYRRDKLWSHLKNNCSDYKKNVERNTKSVPVKNLEALRDHSIPLSEIKGASQDLMTEVLSSMHKDELFITAIKDPLIMKFGSEFYMSRRSEKDRNYVSRECRDLARLLMEVKKIDGHVTTLEECLNPAYFNVIVTAALKMSKYDSKTGTLLVPSVPYRLLPSLKNVTKLAKGEVLSAKYKTGNDLYDSRKEKMLTDFLEMLDSNWSNNIGRLSVKSRKGQVAQAIKKMPLEEDIAMVCEYIISQYRKLERELDKKIEKDLLYDELLCHLVVHIMCLMRRRPVSFKMAVLKNYELMDITNDTEDMAKQAGLSDEELKMCRKFHIFYVQSKNSEIVPVALTPLMKEVLDALIKHRKSVGISGDKLFVMSNNKGVNPAYCMRKIKRKLALKKPADLTANGLRHNAATFSKLHSSNPRYQDYLASALGHSLLVHKKHYELPSSILQKLIVVPTLHKMTVNKQLIHHQNTDGENVEIKKTDMEKDKNDDENNEAYMSQPANKLELENIHVDKITVHMKINRTRWTRQQRQLIFQHFGKEIVAGRCPKRSLVDIFHKRYNHVLKRNLNQVYAYVHNISMKKQKIKTPDRKYLHNRSSRKNSY